MKIRTFILLPAVICLSACATVNMENMGVTAVEKAETQDIQQENVVIRSAKALYTKFTDRGWTKKTEPAPVKTASAFLLKGMNALKKTHDAGFGNQRSDSEAIRSDLLEAASEVERTFKAADVFLSMAPDDADLRAELQVLEKALITCRKSESAFKKALEEAKIVDTDAEMTPLKDVVDNLKAVTDRYGSRVRQSGLQAVIPAS